MSHGMPDDCELHLDAWEIGYIEGVIRQVGGRSVAVIALLAKVQRSWEDLLARQVDYLNETRP